MKEEREHSSESPAAPAVDEPQRRGLVRGAGLSTRLFAIFLVAVLPAIALAFWTGRVERERRSVEMRQQSVRLVGLIASEQRWIMDTGRGIVVAVAHLPQVTQPQSAPCQAVLAGILGYYRALANIGVTDLAGNVVCAARPPPADVNVADRGYFEEVLRTRDFTVGEYQVSRLTNRPSISFAYPVTDELGEPTAVVVAALDLSVLAFVAEQTLTQLPEASVFTVLDRNGVVIARTPDAGEKLGTPLSDAVLRAGVLAGMPGTHREETGGDATLHVYAPVRNPLREEEWYTILSLPESALFGAIHRSFQQSLLVLGLVLVIAAVVGRLVADRLVLRPASRILEATRHLEAGNLGVRLGPDYGAGELGDLARSFDGMVAAIDQRERQLEENQERLSAMSRRLLAAQEEERRRIARELHDELGQLLTGAKLNLVSLQGGSAHPPPGFDPLVDTIDLVGRALTSVRELSTELRPAVLDDAGLEEALHWLLVRVSTRAGFDGHLEAESMDADLAPEIETSLFRFAQEALTNVMRHAAATTVSMTLRQRGGQVELTLEDDGTGFDTEAAHGKAIAGSSLGIVGMQERITLAGGRLEIDSAPGRGTRLRAIVPTTADASQDWDEMKAC
ncbi:MAG TPA: cache domain-containing protein [Thermoanaerobaculia bacterium]|nr:cache domain-containing protein [Thermoanaerobaculia bacterium]